MRDDTIAAFLDQLAARVPAPGGGATAALHAAQAAALLAMAVRKNSRLRMWIFLPPICKRAPKDRNWPPAYTASFPPLHALR